MPCLPHDFVRDFLLDTVTTPLRFHPDTASPSRDVTWAAQAWARVVSVLSALGGAALVFGFLVHRRQVDFEVYVMGGHHFASAQLYAAVQTVWPHLPFTYPPFAALCFAPCAWVPYHLAQILWATLNVVFLASVLRVTLASVRPSASATWWLVALLLGPAAALEPTMLDVSFGQINLLVTLLVLTDATGTLSWRGRTLPRGVLTGVAAALKLTPLLFIPFYFLIGERRSSYRATLTFLVASGFSFLYNPHASWRYWTFYISDVHRIGSAAYISNQSLRGAVDRLAHHIVSSPVLTLASAASGVLGLLTAWVWHRQGAHVLAVLIVADAALIASPISWCHHMIIVIPILIWLWWGSDGLPGQRVWALAVAALFYWAPQWHIPHGGALDLREHGAQLLIGSCFTIASVLFMLGVSAWALQRLRAKR